MRLINRLCLTQVASKEKGGEVSDGSPHNPFSNINLTINFLLAKLSLHTSYNYNTVAVALLC